MMTMTTMTMTTTMKPISPTDTPRPIDLESVNAMIETQLLQWPEARQRFLDLAKAERKPLDTGDLLTCLQLNPARIVSTAADTRPEHIARRRCMICAENRPPQQLCAEWMTGWDFCINPFPILPVHFTIISQTHRPQLQPPLEMAAMAEAAPDLTIFFNGSKGGASIPDHMHLQAVLKDELPLLRLAEKMHPSSRPGFMSSEEWKLNLPFQFISGVISPDTTGMQALAKVPGSFGIDPEGNRDPGLINVFFWMGRNGVLRTVIIPRRRHRPSQYFLENASERLVVAPGAIDMTGIMITPRRDDYERIDAATMNDIYRQVAFADSLPIEILTHFMIRS